MAVVDTEGRLSGAHLHDRFITGSVVKAMLLVAYLRRLHDRGQHYVDGYSNSFLYPMINVSDNSAATQTWSIVGDGALYALAHEAHAVNRICPTATELHFQDRRGLTARACPCGSRAVVDRIVGSGAR